MKRRKICVVITARPSYSRFKTALHAIKSHPELELQLVVAASALLDRYGEATKHIHEDGFEISACVYMVVEGSNPTAMAKTTGLGLLELATIFDNLRPDAVVTIADRYETIATAISATYMNIPLVHIQGGEITGSIDEKVRHAITKLADLHLVSSNEAAERVIHMGEDPQYVINTGCPSIDIASQVLEKTTELDFNPFLQYGGVGHLKDLSEGYLVVLQHPVTTEYQKSREHITETLYALKEINLPVLWFWPNVDAGSDGTSKGIRTFREQENTDKFHFFKHMSSEDFLKLIYHSKVFVGNSSTGIRECAYLGIPVVNIGSRQQGRDRAMNVLDVNYNRQEIIEAIQIQMDHGRYNSSMLYGDGKAGNRIADILANVEFKIEKRLRYS